MISKFLFKIIILCKSFLWWDLIVIIFDDLSIIVLKNILCTHVCVYFVRYWRIYHHVWMSDTHGDIFVNEITQEDNNMILLLNIMKKIILWKINITHWQIYSQQQGSCPRNPNPNPNACLKRDQTPSYLLGITVWVLFACPQPDYFFEC